jgi:hypothetical protein
MAGLHIHHASRGVGIRDKVTSSKKRWKMMARSVMLGHVMMRRRMRAAVV